MLFSHLLFVFLYCITLSITGHHLHWGSTYPDYFLPLFCYHIRHINHPSSLLMSCFTGLGSDIILHHSFPVHSCFFFCCHIVISKSPFTLNKANFLSYTLLYLSLYIPFIVFSHMIGTTLWTKSTASSSLILTLAISPLCYLLFTIYGKVFSHPNLIKKFAQSHA